jgi:hypothetical protein
MKYETISFKFSRELTEPEERIFHEYFKSMYEKLKAAIEMFADKDKHRGGAGMNNIIVKKLMELNRKMPNGMDVSFLVEAKCKQILFHYDDYMILDKNDNDPRIYTFMLCREAFSMNKTGVSYLDNEFMNLFHRGQSQIVNDIRRLALPRMHLRSQDCLIQYGEQEIHEKNN